MQHVELTDHRDDDAEKFARIDPGLTAAHVVAAPYVLVGTIDQLVEELAAHEARWGITSYVVRAAAIDIVAAVIDRLRG